MKESITQKTPPKNRKKPSNQKDTRNKKVTHQTKAETPEKPTNLHRQLLPLRMWIIMLVFYE
jgi:hypothetical protein